jgi:ActR/RegA family two-component response regulator
MSSANAPAPSVSVGGALLVSNDAVTTKQVSESLRQLAMSPEVCVDGPTALGLLSRKKFDAIIVDLQLGSQGIAVLEEVRSSRSNRTAVLLAISDSDVETANAFKGGSNFVLRRPLSYTSIDRTLRVAYGLIVREQRRYFRCPVEIDVVICRTESEDAHGQSVNISEGGMAIKSSIVFKTDSPLLIQFKLPEHDSGFAVEAKICWCREGIVGLQFTALSLKQTSELQEWLAHRLEESFPEYVAAKFRNLGAASPASDGSSDQTDVRTAETLRKPSQDWATLYQSILSESDPGNRLQKIEIAERSMKERWRELVSTGSGDPQERQKLSDALAKLREVREADSSKS